MRKKINVINSILLLLIVACSSLTIAVAQEATKEIRIKIEKDVNGEKQSIDKIFTDPDDPELKKLLKENNMDIEDGDIDLDINIDKELEIENDKDATLKLKLKSDNEDQLNEFIDKIEQLAEDMDIDFSDIDIKKENSDEMFKLFGDDFEDISERLKGQNFNLDTLFDFEGNDLNMYLDDMKEGLKNMDWEQIDPKGQFREYFDFDDRPANKTIMGVMIDDVDDGVLINGITEGFGAEKAGIKEGDIITAIDNKTMKSVNEVIDYINTLAPGDLITVEYVRAGATNTAKVELMESKAYQSERNFKDRFHSHSNKPVMGVMIKDDGNKVLINGISDGFGAEKAGLQEGDIIISVDDKKVNSVGELTDYINNLKVGDFIEVDYERNGAQSSTEVELMKSITNSDYPRYFNWIEKFDKDDLDFEKDFFNNNTRVMIMITDLDEADENKLNEISPNSRLKSNDLELEQFEFFPNPGKGLFNLSFEVDERIDTEVNIYDLSGKIVYNKFLKNFKGEFDESINMQSNETGSYILEIIQGDKRTNKKIVVK